MLVIRNCLSISFYGRWYHYTCLCSLPIFRKCLIKYLKKNMHVLRTYKFKVRQIPLTNWELSMSDAESCGRQTAKVSQIDKGCQNPTIIKKNHKLIKPSFHPLARWLRREFLLFFIVMRGSYVVCDFPQGSTSPLRVVGTYKYGTNSSRQSSHRSCRLERFFHAPCPERIMKMTKSSASVSSLMVTIFPTFFLHFK